MITYNNSAYKKSDTISSKNFELARLDTGKSI